MRVDGSLFGKSGQEIDAIILDRRADARFCRDEPSCLARRRSGLRRRRPTIDLCMVAYAFDKDAPLLRVGQKVKAGIFPFRGYVFEGGIVVRGAAADRATRPMLSRCEIVVPDHLLPVGAGRSESIRRLGVWPSISRNRRVCGRSRVIR